MILRCRRDHGWPPAVRSFLVIAVLVLSLGAGQPGLADSPYPWLDSGSPVAGTIHKRIPPPTGYSRVPREAGDFAHWLRNLPLRPHGSPVLLFPVTSGKLKSRQDIHHAVVDLDVLRYQQCADTAMRLWAEYLWSERRTEDELCFDVTSGDKACWKDWVRGMRPKLSNDGRRLSWIKQAGKDGSRQEFLRYLDLVMTYAGSYSLKKELAAPGNKNLREGDLLIDGGFPGHAVIVVDLAKNAAGEEVVLLAQSYMPSQELHVLKNLGEPLLSPWYSVTGRTEIHTPEWRPFVLSEDLRRFPVGNHRRASPGMESGSGKSLSDPSGRENEKALSSGIVKVPGRYPEASLRILTVEDLAGKDRRELQLMRNEIFARHGYIFRENGAMDIHFSRQSWYLGRSRNVFQEFSAIERHNIELIRHQERLR